MGRTSEMEVQFNSVAHSCPTLCDPMYCSTLGFPVLHCLQSLLKLLSIQSVMPSNHLILCHPLFLLLSIFPSISVFSDESALHIRWPEYWSFSFSTSPSNECSRLISFRIDWFDHSEAHGLLQALPVLSGCAGEEGHDLVFPFFQPLLPPTAGLLGLGQRRGTQRTQCS